MNPNDFKQMFPAGGPNVKSAPYFTGKSYVAPLATGGDVNVNNVTFEPSCRNFWHIHHGAIQTLICTADKGWVQLDGQPAQRLQAGDVVEIPAETKHWHGADKDSWFSHLAMMKNQADVSTEWLEEVSDEQYLAVHQD